MDRLAEILGRSPEWFPYTLDAINDTVSFIRLRAEDYANASFLDPRILTPQTVFEVLPWSRVTSALETLTLVERCAFIFHIGHVGSTLLSRLIGAHPHAFSLREPLLLRIFAQNPGAALLEGKLDATLKLLSRTYQAQQHTIVKATSFVSEFAPRLLERPQASPSLMMLVSPESYIATILGGPNSRQEARHLAPERLLRLHRRIGREAWRLDQLSEGEWLALAWACEASSLAAAANERTWFLDFDHFLAEPVPLLFAALRHFNIEATPGEVQGIIAGPLMSQYSKATEFAYDAGIRAAVLASARAEHRREIRRGLGWLERAGADFTPIKGALELAKSARR